MEFGRFGALFARLQEPRPGAEHLGTRLCLACTEVLEVSGAGVLLVDGDGGSTSFGTSDASPADVVEDLQFTLGEGPGLDAHANDQIVSEPDLAHPAIERWSSFAPAAVQKGIRRVFSFPLRAGDTRLGALDLSSGSPGPLTPQQVRDAEIMAALVTQMLLSAQADARPGRLPPDLDDAGTLRLRVHQAAGMVAQQLDVRASDALLLLRAAAYAGQRPIDAIARDVVDRKIRIAAYLDGRG